MRILIDRLWPRGITSEQAAADLWLKDAAPSDALRRWYGHTLVRWTAFRRKYRSELARRPEILRLLDEIRRHGPVTLLFGARDTAHNNAVVLSEILNGNPPLPARARGVAKRVRKRNDKADRSGSGAA
ncbi:MAG: hypothetical protein NFCOHLIN_00566 [Gammaproteobacteria bacterium]|nr:hypothetical protein [Gammaproteobacteria bacterium]